MPSDNIFSEIANRHFGWYTRHFSRTWEYQWIAARIDDAHGMRMIDAGAGQSPLPIYFAERGASVTTVDFGVPGGKNEWGFFDYSSVGYGMTSVNGDFTRMSWAQDRTLDCIISVSVIEHMPALDRQRAWAEFARLLKPGGRIILTIDLQKEEIFRLWNRSQGKKVEDDVVHGTLGSMLGELESLGFVLERYDLCPLREGEVRVAGLCLVKGAAAARTSGHMAGKYTKEYYTGEGGAVAYAVAGHKEFHGGGVSERIRREFSAALPILGSYAGKDILDLGCGRGEAALLAVEHNCRSYTGMDFSPSALEIARDRVKDPRVRFVQAEAANLEPAGSFDIILLLDMLEHVPPYEADALLSSVRRMLRPGGLVIISTPIFENPNMADHSDRHAGSCGMHCNKQSLGTLLRLLNLHGLIAASRDERIFCAVCIEDLDGPWARHKDAFCAAQREIITKSGASGEALVQPPGRLAIGCVAEATPKYLAQALRLLQSLRWFGGSCAGANFYVCTVGTPDEHYARQFERYGAFMRTVSRVCPDHPHSNKLAFYGLPELASYDTILLIDCDTVFVADPLPSINGKTLQCKIADLPTLTREHLEPVFAHFGLAMPEAQYRFTMLDSPTIWYCNSGVVAMPREMLKSFVPVWMDFNSELCTNLDLLGERRMFCDQASLALAYAKAMPAFEPLPMGMNLPTHLSHRPAPPGIDEIDPVILHYHDKVDASGFLLPVPYRGTMARIAAFNARLKEERDIASHAAGPVPDAIADGERLFGEGKYREALETFQSEIDSIERQRGELLNNIAVTMAHMGELAKAEEILQGLINSGQYIADARENLKLLAQLKEKLGPRPPGR